MMATATDARRTDAKRAAELVEELNASGALDDLSARTDAGEVELTGDGRPVSALIKETRERGLRADMISHLGYEHGEREDKTAANSRNGSYAKTVASEAGDIELTVPRDRDSSFAPRLVPKGSRRLGSMR